MLLAVAACSNDDEGAPAAMGRDASVAADGAMSSDDAAGAATDGGGLAPSGDDAGGDAASDAASDAGPSGWKSGAYSADLGAFATYRGRALDAMRFGNCDGTWAQLSASDCGQLGGLSPSILALEGEAMFPDDGSGSFATCATGAYDSYFEAFGAALVAASRGSSVIALGWEANGNWYPWSFGVQSGDTAAQTVSDYIACFRHEAQAIKSADPAAVISWNMNRQSYTGTTSVIAAFPGDDVVDEIAVDYYDIDGVTTTSDAWSQECGEEQNGGPEGLCAWLAFAQSHGKKLGIPEWGLSTGDDPGYIEQMYEWFAASAGAISYESYFNGGSDTGSGSLIFPTSNNPSSSRMYQELWVSSPRP